MPSWGLTPRPAGPLWTTTRTSGQTTWPARSARATVDCWRGPVRRAFIPAPIVSARATLSGCQSGSTVGDEPQAGLGPQAVLDALEDGVDRLVQAGPRDLRLHRRRRVGDAVLQGRGRPGMAPRHADQAVLEAQRPAGRLQDEIDVDLGGDLPVLGGRGHVLEVLLELALQRPVEPGRQVVARH